MPGKVSLALLTRARKVTGALRPQMASLPVVDATDCTAHAPASAHARAVDAGAAPQPVATSAVPASHGGQVLPPQHLCCPVSLELMQDPVVVATGITYDRDSITRWLDAGHRTCPSTGVRLRHLELVPNFALRSAIEDYAEAHGILLKARAVPDPGVPTYLNAHHPGGFADNVEAELEDVAPSEEEAEQPPPASHVLQGHDEIVWAVEVSPTSGRVYTASADGSVRCWDAHSRRCIAVLEGHTRPVLALALSDRHLFSGSYDNTIRVWCIRSLRRVAVLNGHDDAVRALQVMPSCRTLFSASYDRTLRAWCLDTLQQFSGPSGDALKGHTGPVRALAALGGRLFSASYDKTVRCWDASHLLCLGTMEGHREAVRALSALPQHGLLASGSDDWTVRLWNAETMACVAVCEGHSDNVRVLATCGDTLFSGSWDHTVRAWALGTSAAPGTCVAVMSGHREAVLALAVCRGHVVSGSFDTSVRFWSTTAHGFPCVAKSDGHEDAVRVLSSSGPEAETCYSGSYDGCIGFLRVPPLLCPSVLPPPSTSSSSMVVLQQQPSRALARQGGPSQELAGGGSGSAGPSPQRASSPGDRAPEAAAAPRSAPPQLDAEAEELADLLRTSALVSANALQSSRSATDATEI